MKNSDFIIFSSIDWPTHWQIHHQLATSLALNGNRVLFVENTGVRSINTGDFNRIKDRVVSWKNSMRGYKDVSNRIVVYSPLLLPFPYSKVALFFNKILFKKSLLSWIDSANFNNPIVISFLPTPVVHYVIKAINPSLLVYYCANDFSKSSISAKGISPYEDRFIFEADMVFVISHSLMDKVKKIFSHLNYLKSGQEVIDESDVILILTEWPEFRNLDFGDKLVIDGKNLFFDTSRPKNYQGICW